MVKGMWSCSCTCLEHIWKGRDIAVPIPKPENDMWVHGQFSVHPVHPEGEHSQYQSGRRLGGPPNWDGSFVEDKNKNLLLLLGIEP